MPEYEVSHAIELTTQQKDKLAQAISELHANTFDTPKLWVYVFFTDVSHVDSYRAGKRFKENRIHGAIRNGPMRTRDDFVGLAIAIAKAWDNVLEQSVPESLATNVQNEDTSLNAMILVGDILAGIEVGFVVPSAGQDRLWLKENMDTLKKRADNGEHQVKSMIDDIQSRGMV